MGHRRAPRHPDARAHGDLDLVVGIDEADRAAGALGALGFRVTSDESPTRLVLEDHGGRGIDLHLVRRDDAGNGVQALPGVASFRYPREGLAGAGRIAGVTVACLTAPVQVLVHCGYEPDDDERRDMALLQAHTGVVLPSPYAEADPAAAAPRLATASDGGAIAVVRQRSWRVIYRGLLPDAVLDGMDLEAGWRFWTQQAGSPASARHATIVIGRPGEVVGFVAIGPSRDTDKACVGGWVGEVVAIYLDPATWGLGLGRVLLDAAVARLRADGASEAMLWVLDGNDRARRFYERAG